MGDESGPPGDPGRADGSVHLAVKRAAETLRPRARALSAIVLQHDRTVEARYVDGFPPTSYATILEFLCEHSLDGSDLEVVADADPHRGHRNGDPDEPPPFRPSKRPASGEYRFVGVDGPRKRER